MKKGCCEPSEDFKKKMMGMKGEKKEKNSKVKPSMFKKKNA